ncbi:hypothetical protein ACIBVL_17960 [Streptomyces sp. NPDC049687]|uniref:hypothetical protein n=1 Tax=Streptomyces sp. NPDC049687 TaxID=3365596 RepID=UPI0037B5DDED
MSTALVPQQPEPTRADTPPAPPPVPPHASEATRLLCAGTYLDSAYRDRVIEELHLNEQRIVAPSLGFDAARVLAHALRARRQELAWAVVIVAVWAVGLPLTDYWLVGFLFPGGLLAVAPLIRGDMAQPPVYRRLPAFIARWTGRCVYTFFLAATLYIALGGGDESFRYQIQTTLYDLLPDLIAPDAPTSSDDVIGPLRAWLAVGVFLLAAACTIAQRDRFTRALADELSLQRFPDAAADPAEHAEGRRFQRLKHRIRLEQHAPLIMYHEARPFCGAGTSLDPWVLAVELRPDGMKKQLPLSNRTVLEKIRPRLERLRLPAEHAGPSARDRLRWLEIDECVFLPVEGLLRRAEAPYDPGEFENHRARAVEEGAEKRRHFLRIRVGGWEEELVVTVFVRIHTQGRMLMLEIAPHVLTPVREEFKNADRTAHRFRNNSVVGKTVWALAQSPGSGVRAVATVGRSLRYLWQLLTGGYSGALPDGPALSVRELGAAPAGSLFQDMDVERYLKSVQDRIAHGVKAALAESGYQTGEFVQKIVNVSNGGVNIDSVEGSTFAVGEHASAATVSGGAAPQKGADTDGHG